jgi:hypothetical protein
MQRIVSALLAPGALLLAALLPDLAAAQPAGSTKNCYETIGCPWKDAARLADLRKLSCESLAHVRNRLYHENGYCFQQQANKERYGNKGCRYPVQQLVPLDSVERANIAKVRKVEKEKRC